MKTNENEMVGMQDGLLLTASSRIVLYVLRDKSPDFRFPISKSDGEVRSKCVEPEIVVDWGKLPSIGGNCRPSRKFRRFSEIFSFCGELRNSGTNCISGGVAAAGFRWRKRILLRSMSGCRGAKKWQFEMGGKGLGEKKGHGEKKRLGETDEKRYQSIEKGRENDWECK
jgi:hypothetical protein